MQFMECASKIYIGLKILSWYDFDNSLVLSLKVGVYFI